MSREQLTKIVLPEDKMPRFWYNICLLYTSNILRYPVLQLHVQALCHQMNTVNRFPVRFHQ